MKLKLFSLIIFSFVILSCSQKTKYCKITKTSIDGYPQSTYYYDGEKLNRIETYSYSTGQLQSTSVFYYDLQGRVDFMNQYNANGTLATRTEVSYDGYGNIGALYFIADTDSDGYPDASTGHLIFTHNANHQLTFVSQYNGSNTFIGLYTLTWVGDILTTVEYPAGNYDVFTFDDRSSRFGNVLEEMFVYNQNFESLVNHNLIQIQHYDSGDNLTTTDNYTITYNADGLPEALNTMFVILGFEYQCEEK